MFVFDVSSSRLPQDGSREFVLRKNDLNLKKKTELSQVWAQRVRISDEPGNDTITYRGS